MKIFDELEAYYSAEITRALYELRTSGATADEIRKPVTRRAFLFQSAHHKHIQPHFARCVAVEVALALGVASHGKLNQRGSSLD